jgi:hypothetical protein
VAFPGIAFWPEKGESNRRSLRCGDRNIDELDSESGCRRRSVVDGTPFVVRPMETERSRNLDAQPVTSFDDAHLSIWLPDLE